MRRARPAWQDVRIVLAVVVGLVLAWALTGCAPTRTVYVDRPGPERIVERPVYVSIPPALTARPVIATGPLDQCPAVARDRRTQLELDASRFEAIAKIQGQAVPAAP